jgi:hypothetical protein
MFGTKTFSHAGGTINFCCNVQPKDFKISTCMSIHVHCIPTSHTHEIPSQNVRIEGLNWCFLDCSVSSLRGIPASASLFPPITLSDSFENTFSVVLASIVGVQKLSHSGKKGGSYVDTRLEITLSDSSGSSDCFALQDACKV